MCARTDVHASLAALIIRDPQCDVCSTVPATPAASWMADLIEINKQQIHDASIAAEFSDPHTKVECVCVCEGLAEVDGACDRPVKIILL